MASVSKQLPASPKHASRRRSQFDRLHDPALLKALAEPTRARMLSCLLKCSRPCTVTEIAECCSIDFSTIARHLSMMAKAGLLTSEKQGRSVLYSANGEALAAHFRALADAIDKTAQIDGCCEQGGCACTPAGD